ncbi:MAG: DNA repair protein RecO [bacterium]|nr:DNA repair protein RecO [bacterium]
MSTLIRSDGIVLRTIRHGETSLILTVFMRETGRESLMAKGVRARSRHGGSAGLELLCEAQFIYYHKGGRDLQLLKEWSLHSAHASLRADFDGYVVANALAELLGHCLRESDPHPELYAAASATLDALDRLPTSPLPLLWAFELKLFRTLGFGFRFEDCAASGRPLIAPFRAPIRYRLSDGAFFHPDVPAGVLSDGVLSGEAFAVLASLSSSSNDFAGKIKTDPRIRTELSLLFARYLETHLSVRGALRSLDALNWERPSP